MANSTLPALGNLVAPTQAPAPQTPARQTPQGQQQLAQGWQEYLKRPEVQAGLLQFTIDVMQPVAPGQSTLGHVASSVAGGGAAVGRVRESQRAEADKAREADLAERLAQVEEESPVIERERIASEAHSAAETAAAQREVSENGIAAYMERLRLRIAADKELSLNEWQSNLLRSVIESSGNIYAQQLAATLPGDPLPKPPLLGDIMTKFNILSSVVQNKGIIPDGTIPDEDLIALLTSENKAERDRARGLLARISPTQRDRVLPQVERILSTPKSQGPLPHPTSTPPKKPSSSDQGLSILQRTRRNLSGPRVPPSEND